MSYNRKTTDLYVVYGDYGFGYEEIYASENKQEAMRVFRDYNQNEPLIMHKVEKHRVAKFRKD